MYIMESRKAWQKQQNEKVRHKTMREKFLRSSFERKIPRVKQGHGRVGSKIVTCCVYIYLLNFNIYAASSTSIAIGFYFCTGWSQLLHEKRIFLSFSNPMRNRNGWQFWFNNVKTPPWAPIVRSLSTLCGVTKNIFLLFLLCALTLLNIIAEKCFYLNIFLVLFFISISLVCFRFSLSLSQVGE